jgi:hypothetical protein
MLRQIMCVAKHLSAGSFTANHCCLRRHLLTGCT